MKGAKGKKWPSWLDKNTWESEKKTDEETSTAYDRMHAQAGIHSGEKRAGKLTTSGQPIYYDLKIHLTIPTS